MVNVLKKGQCLVKMCLKRGRSVVNLWTNRDQCVNKGRSKGGQCVDISRCWPSFIVSVSFLLYPKFIIGLATS